MLMRIGICCVYGGLLNEDDERVKCVLGLMAYRKLIQLKESV